MVSVVGDPNQALYNSMGGLAQVLGGLGGQYAKQQQIKQQGNILQNILNNLGPDATPQDFMMAAAQYQKAGGSTDFFKNFASLFERQMKDRANVDLLNMVLNPDGQVVAEDKLDIESNPQVRQSSPTASTSSTDPLAKYSTEQVKGLLIHPNTNVSKLAQASLDDRKRQDDLMYKERDYHTQRNKDYLKEMRAEKDKLDNQNLALQMSEDAIARGDVGPTSWNNIGQRFGIPELMSSSGKQITNAGKQFLIGGLRDVSAKAQNMWMEQVMSSAFPRIGESKHAQATAQMGLRAENDLRKTKLDIFEEEKAKDLQKYGYERADLETRVNERYDRDSKKILDELSYKTRRIWEDEQGYKNLEKTILKKKVPQGTMITVPALKIFLDKFKDKEEALQHAKKLGYQIPTRAQAELWEGQTGSLLPQRS